MAENTKKSFQSILTSFRKYSFSERDKGNKFEQLMQAYLQTDKKYSDRFTHVWLWSAFPSNKDFGGKDTGIDIVAKTVEGDYWAILMEIIEDRHGKNSTIVTSQVPVNKWYEIIGEQTVADAILDRIVHESHRLELKGESMRKKNMVALEKVSA